MINFYVRGEKLISIMSAIAQAENFSCNFHQLKPGATLNPDAENFIIARKFPLQPLPNVKYILCSASPADLSTEQLEAIYDLWPETLTTGLLKFFFRDLITKIKAAHNSQERKYQKRILEMAQQDYLTGLATRWYLHEYAESKRAEPNMTCIYFDLDNFKTVNDTYGHQEGDRALAATAELMQVKFADGFCARMGGDEFMIVIPGENSAREIQARVDENFIRILRERPHDEELINQRGNFPETRRRREGH